MANYKSDIEKKLNTEKEALLKDVPEFLYTYIEEALPAMSNELRSHIAYAKDIINFLNYYGSKELDKPMQDITLNDMDNVNTRIMNRYFKYITQYEVTFTSSKGKKVTRVRTNSTATKSRKLAALKKLYEYLIESKLVNNNPVENMKIPKPDITKINNRLQSDEIFEIKNEINLGSNILSSREGHAHERLKLRDLTIFYISAYTGIRVSELVSLDISDVDINKCTIRIVRKNNKIQEIPYPSEISSCIEDYMKYRENINDKVPEKYKKALFLSQQMKRITDQSVRILLKKYCSRLNIEDISCHTFRRTFLSSLYNVSKDVKLVAKVGGHSISTASKYYVDVDEERLRNEIRVFSYGSK